MDKFKTGDKAVIVKTEFYPHLKGMTVTIAGPRYKTTVKEAPGRTVFAYPLQGRHPVSDVPWVAEEWKLEPFNDGFERFMERVTQPVDLGKKVRA